MKYSDEVMDHFQNPRNVGVIKDSDGVGKIGNPVCGDTTTFYIKVKDDKIHDIKFQTLGCGAAIASASIVSELAKGKTLDEAMSITSSQVVEALGGLPEKKVHCSNLGADALHKAVENFRAKQKGEEREADKKMIEEKEFMCPKCDDSLSESELFCRRCHIELACCPECGKPKKKADEECPHCGATKVRV
ncbi:MAG: iron-sulfur cluster assembly scaffold protein [Candidatus Aminicenantes bacterium]|nr:iron-sulfur cluster assembly scaffold protein [Candidatus Aminicenantes bacterium]